MSETKIRVGPARAEVVTRAAAVIAHGLYRESDRGVDDPHGDAHAEYLEEGLDEAVLKLADALRLAKHGRGTTRADAMRPKPWDIEIGEQVGGQGR